MKLYALMIVSAFAGLACLAQAAPARQPIKPCLLLSASSADIAEE